MDDARGGILGPSHGTTQAAVIANKNKKLRSFKSSEHINEKGDVPYRGFHYLKVQVGKDQEKAQSDRDSHSKKPSREKTKLTIRHLYHETYRKPNEQLFSQ